MSLLRSVNVELMRNKRMQQAVKKRMEIIREGSLECNVKNGKEYYRIRYCEGKSRKMVYLGKGLSTVGNWKDNGNNT